MIKIYNNKDIKEYRNSKYLNQTTLKNLSKGLDIFKELQERKSDGEHFILGSLVDNILLSENFKENYFIDKSNINIEKGIKDIINNIYKLNNKKSIENNKDEIKEYLNESDWRKNWNINTRLNKVINDGKDYFNILKESNNREIISNDIFKKANDIVLKLINCKYTSKYFNIKDISKNENLEVYYQKPIYNFYKGNKDFPKIKGLIDIIYIDHKEKTIEVIDLKTIGDSIIKFPNQYISFKYYLQAYFYLMLVSLEFNNNLIIPYGYKIKVFKWIVASTKYDSSPTCYSMPPDELDKIENSEFPYVNIDKLVDDYKYYEENGYDIDRKIIENEGNIELIIN